MRISDWSSDVCSSDLDTLIEQLWLEHGDIRRVEAEEELRLLRRQARQEGNPAPSLEAGPIIGSSPAFIQAFSLLGKAAQSSINVLLLGETGVGKEVFARWLHEKGPRGGGPFVADRKSTRLNSSH